MRPARPAPVSPRRFTRELATSDGWKLKADLLLVDEPVGAAVLCHPHPLHGGTREHPLMTASAERLVEVAHDSIRFDFRRDRADVISEVPDLIAASDLIRSTSGVASLTLIGYSFGALVTLAAAPRVAPHKLILVAPPLAAATALPAPAVPTTVIVGRHDQYCNPDELAQTEFGYSSTVVVIEGTDHFLHGHIDQVTSTMLSAVSSLEERS